MVNRHFPETQGQRSDHVALSIMDIQGMKDVHGTVVRSMSRPTSWWSGTMWKASPREVGNMSRMVELLERGPYAAVNGRGSWRVSRTVDTRMESTLEQIAKLNRPEAADARELLKPMESEGAVLVSRGRY